MVSNSHSEIVYADTMTEAKEKAWKSIKGGWTYGWKSKDQFMNNVVAVVWE